jgi:hypothetical protein
MGYLLANDEKSLPEQDAMAVDPENPWRFLRSIKWKKAMEGFFHRQLGVMNPNPGRRTESVPSAADNHGPRNGRT